MRLNQYFSKTIEKLDSFQESCIELSHGLKVLLGENVSIADISVNPDAFEDDDMDESIITQNQRGQLIKRTGGKATKLDPESQRSVEQALKSGEKILSAGDNEEPPEDEQKKSTLQRIKKTESILASDRKLRKLINDYFDMRREGNFGQAQNKKDAIEEIILNRDLDRETVYTFYNLDVAQDLEDNSDSEEE